MYDPFMTNLSLGWFLLAAGAIGALVIAIYKPADTPAVAAHEGRIGSQTQNLTPVARRSLIVAFIVLASCGALLIQADHNWLPFQMPHL